MKEKQKIHYSVWKRFVDGIYTCKDIEELLADKKTDRSKDFDEASACLWKTGEEESSSSWEEWISNERQALQIISNYEDITCFAYPCPTYSNRRLFLAGQRLNCPPFCS